MATVQLSKIQLRRGVEADLPGAGFSSGLDDGELGFTVDSGRLFVGISAPTSGMPNFNRADFPYQNIEVLTENSPGIALRPLLADNQAGFFASVPLTITASYLTLQTYDPSAVPQDFILDLPLSGVNAIIWYYVFASNHDAMRQGTLNVVWNSSMVGSPVLLDTPVLAVGSLSDLQWTATYDGTHVVLQYINQTGDTPIVNFRIDRPLG